MTKLKGIVLALMLALPVTAAAQNTPKDEAAEKQRKMNLLIEQVVADIPDLKLGENRAFVFASLGNLVWKADPAAGRGLFDKAIAELMAAQALAGSAKKTMYGQNELLTGNSVRPQILNIIARRDAEMALDALIRTRPSIIHDALQYQAGKSQKVSNYSSNNYLSQNELNMEQTFLRMAADQNPERAASLLRESLKKGVSGETLNLLKKLHDKDPATAATLGSEIVDKMLKSKFMTAGDQPDYGLISAATTFLTDFIRERGPNDKSFTFSASQMRSLAGQLISFQLDQGNSRGYFGGNVLQIAEKLSPASVERLRQVQRNYGGFGHDYDPEVQRVVGSNLSADQLLSEAKRFPMAQRAGIYQTAAQKYAQAGNMAAARQILEDNFSDGALENAIQSLDWQNVSNLQSAGKFAEAELIIDEMPEINRIPALINLANNALNKNEAENRSYAIGVLGKARSLIGDRPENNHEMSTLLQIAGVYARLDPNESFGLLSSLLPQINEITNAAIVFTQFQGNQSIRQGEILMSQGSTVGIYLDYSVFQKLEKVDFERTANLIAGLDRIETRIKLRLQLAENGLN